MTDCLKLKTVAISGFADNNSHLLCEATKIICGPQRKTVILVKGTESNLIRDNSQIAMRRTEHFSSLLYPRNPIQADYTDNHLRAIIETPDTFPTINRVKEQPRA